MARENFTAGRVAVFRCPAGKAQAFMWDAKAPGLALRVTAGGARAYIFQSRLKDGGGVRMTIGDPASWSIPDAQAEARRLQGIIDRGADPRIEKAATVAQHAAQREAAKAERARREVTALDAWHAYMADRAEQWGTRHHADHAAMVAPGGAERRRAREKVTVAGPLHALLARPLAELDGAAVEEWVAREAKVRGARTALGFRLLRAFVNWCAEHPEYRAIVDPEACKGRRARQKLPKPAAKDDALQREQLAAWFAAVGHLSPAMRTYLQVLLLTGCRPGEALDLRWEDVDFQWRALRIRDKVEGERTIPLTPYVAGLLRELHAINHRPPTVPRRIRANEQAAEAFARAWRASPWVFATRHAAGGRIADGREAHNRALAAAGLPHVTLHGLRRSFGTLAEWVECPVGVVAQIQGHKPSAIAEKHYRVRPLDLLRVWHERIEAWVLGEAGIAAPAAAAAPTLRAIDGGGA